MPVKRTSRKAVSRFIDRGAVADRDNDDNQHRVFQPTEQPPVAHAVAPVAVPVAAQGFAKGGGVGRAADALIQVLANLVRRGGAEVA